MTSVDNNLPFTFTVADAVHNTSDGMHKTNVHVHHVPFHSCDYGMDFCRYHSVSGG